MKPKPVAKVELRSTRDLTREVVTVERKEGLPVIVIYRPEQRAS